MRPLDTFASCWLLATFAGFTVGGDARAQCATQWLPGPAIAGTDAAILAIREWDPDGAGPGTPVLVLGGAFHAAGTLAANRIAALDPLTNVWSTFASGMNGHVRALAVLPNGDLVAGGDFTSAGGAPANHVAVWNGSVWAPLGTGTDDDVLALAVLANGDLVAAGEFTTAGGIAASRVARWDGFGWAPLGLGVDGIARALVVLQNGDLIAGGTFANAGGAPASRIASWDGTSWSPLGSGIAAAAPSAANVKALTVLATGELVAGGAFDTAGGITAINVARWSGSSWAPLGAGIAAPVNAVCTHFGTNLIAVGEILGSPYTIRRWNGTSWSSIGTMHGSGEAVVQLTSGDVVVGGTVYDVFGPGQSNTGVTNAAVWNGTTWRQIGPPLEDPFAVTSVAAHPNGDLVAGAWSGGYRVLRCDGTTWQRVGAAFDFTVLCVATAANGDILAGGGFAAVGGVPAPGVARWNGTAWSPIGSFTSSNHVGALLPLPNGDIIAGGNFLPAGSPQWENVARWNGTAWVPMGTGLPGTVLGLALAPNGDILACGWFNLAGSRVARWNGTAWLPVGVLPDGVFAVTAMPNGDIIAAGTFLAAGIQRIARWNGTSWQPLGSGLTTAVSTTVPIVRGVAALPDGDIVASGTFTLAGGVPCRGVARWNGASWSALATNVPVFPEKSTSMPNGDVVVSGVRVLDGVVSSGFARLTTTCPGTATASGAACSGQALAVTALPWTGSAYRARATGLPTNALAVDVFGVATAAIPLVQLLPQGVAGCSLLVNPDASAVVVPSGGEVSTQLTIPNAAALVGAVVHEQVLTLALGTGGAITAFAGTNRLTLTVGMF